VPGGVPKAASRPLGGHVKIAIYDATLTEGARAAGLQLTVRDRMRIALRLAEMGVAYVEGGWPSGRGGDTEVFRAARRLEMGGTKLCACATLGRRGRARDDVQLRAALRSGAKAVTLFVSAPTRTGRAVHIGSAVHAVRSQQKAALVELDGFFDAWRLGHAGVLGAVEAASLAGAEAVILSDRSGGALPHEVEAAVVAARRVARRVTIGVRARDDAGVAVANSLAAVTRGATLVAATVNGYGERCGAANLVPITAALELKMGHQVFASGQLRRLSSLAHFVSELAERELPRERAYVGRDAFALAKGDGPPHVDPEAVGNRSEPALADERGHPDALRVARTLGLKARDETTARKVLARLGAWEKRGFRYEGAEASFELLLRALGGRRRPYFTVQAYRIFDLHEDDRSFTEATVELTVGHERFHTASTGVGPVHALDRALRLGLERHYPELLDMTVVQSRSRNLASGAGTAGPVRVLIESADARDHWGTAGVSDDLLDACCQALVDAIEYKLLKDDVKPRNLAPQE